MKRLWQLVFPPMVEPEPEPTDAEQMEALEQILGEPFIKQFNHQFPTDPEPEDPNSDQ